MIIVQEQSFADQFNLLLALILGLPSVLVLPSESSTSVFVSLERDVEVGEESSDLLRVIGPDDQVLLFLNWCILLPLSV